MLIFMYRPIYLHSIGYISAAALLSRMTYSWFILGFLNRGVQRSLGGAGNVAGERGRSGANEGL